VTSDTRICALADCYARFVPIVPRQRYCSAACGRLASTAQQMAWQRNAVLYAPTSPTAQHVCAVCRRIYDSRVRDSRTCSLACADRVPA